GTGVVSAAHAIFTVHEYDPQYLLGVKESVQRTEMLVLHDEEGVFVIRYDALRRDFVRYRRFFVKMLDTLELAVVEKPPPE
ncbi:MAG: hypothetical protein KGL53_00450, partial [Elusimicrobia bacterium]|nr:hypothetical protein [Elusimicrobiota bacterium]